MKLTEGSSVSAPPTGFKAQFFSKGDTSAAAPPVAAPPPQAPPAEQPPAPEPPSAGPADEPIITPPEPAKSAVTDKKGLDAFSDDAAEPQIVEESKDEEEPPAGVKTKEARDAWRRMRTEAKDAQIMRKELAELKSKLESTSKIADADPLKKELEELRKRDEEREREASIWRVERTAAYKQAVTEPLASLEEEAVSIAKENEVDVDKLLDAISTPDKKARMEKIADITDGMSEGDKFQVYDLAKNVQTIYAKRDKLEANAHTAFTEAQAREKEESERSKTERRAAEIRSVVEMKPKIAGAAKLLAREGETPEAYAERIIADANAVPFDEQGPAERAFMAVVRGLFDDMAPKYKEALKEIETLKKQVAGMVSATPRTTAGAPANSADAQRPSGLYEGLFGRKPPWAKI